MANEQIFDYEDEHGVTRAWNVNRLWELSKKLPHKRLPMSMFTDIIEKWLRQNCKDYKDDGGKVIVYIDDFERIRKADLKYPVILMASGEFVMDGNHRMMKEWLSGSNTVLAVQFETDPPPDKITGDKSKPTSSKW